MKHALTLVVITLLQLCRAEISNSLPEWYAANLINDSYQPKPITEIFTTPETFSSRNPIIVASTPSTTEAEEVSETTSTSGRQTTVTESTPSTEDTTQRVLPLEQDTSILFRSPIEREQSQIYQPQPRQIQVLVAQPPQPPPVPQIPLFPQIQTPQQQSTGQPNYFLIYQQAPLSIQQYPESASQSRPSSTETEQRSTSEPVTQRATQENFSPSTTNLPDTSSSTTTQTTTIVQEINTEIPQSTITTIQTNSSAPAPTNRVESLLSTSVPILFRGPLQNPSTLPGPTNSSPPISSTVPPAGTLNPCPNQSVVRVNSTAIANISDISTQKPNKITSLTIRVTAPRGSITNIKINPSTTTKKPSTRRTQGRKGHNYNICVNSCKGKKEPICGAPLAVVPIDPNKLKGFPSICHLACHNSFRKNQPFEKIMDGRCSKLRTRIRTIDKSKIKREELNKSQYTVLSNIPETIFQIIPNERSG